MKIKNIAYFLGLKPKPKLYSYSIQKIQTNLYGSIQFAQWLHPKARRRGGYSFNDDAISFCKKIIQEGDFCIDVGAHEGDTTIPIALAAGKKGMVLALEPNRYVFPVLNKNAFLNEDIVNIYPLMVAATNQYEDIEFEYSDAGFCNGGLHEGIDVSKHGHVFKLMVTGVNLQTLLYDKFHDRLPKLKYIKIDAEGFDFSIVKSLENIIDEFKPYLKVEVYKYTDSNYREGLYDFIENKGYTIYREEHDYREFKRIKSEDMMQKQHFDIFCVPANRDFAEPCD